jgi:hypothetical protein
MRDENHAQVRRLKGLDSSVSSCCRRATHKARTNIHEIWRAAALPEGIARNQ